MIVEVHREDVLCLIYPNLDRGRYLLIVNHIEALMRRDWVVQCCRIHRYGNKVSDTLTKFFDSSHLNYFSFSVLPSPVAGLLQEDVDLLLESQAMLILSLFT
ncbi:hypothetical protein V6N13_019919 [Hibiscus sabdariffa]